MSPVGVLMPDLRVVLVVVPPLVSLVVFGRQKVLKERAGVKVEWRGLPRGPRVLIQVERELEEQQDRLRVSCRQPRQAQMKSRHS